LEYKRCSFWCKKKLEKVWKDAEQFSNKLGEFRNEVIQGRGPSPYVEVDSRLADTLIYLYQLSMTTTEKQENGLTTVIDKLDAVLKKKKKDRFRNHT